MKHRLLIIIGIVATLAIGSVSLLYYQEIQLATGIIASTDCRYDEIKHNDTCLKLEIPQHIGSWSYGIDSIVSYCEEVSTPSNAGFGLERCIPIQFVDVDELITRIQNNDIEPLSWPSSVMLLWCAERFDSTKHDFLENYDGCDTSDCSAEPPLFLSALSFDEEFIENGCAKFVDKWAYMTEDNDYTWHSIYWESFVKHHYESDPISDPQRNQKCTELFDLIYLNGMDSDLWYELTETNDFRDAKCASIFEEWEHLAENNVWNIGINWEEIASNDGE